MSVTITKLHCYYLLCLTIFTIFPLCVISSNILSATQSLTNTQTLVSSNGMFELGFFNPSNSDNWYVGTWYKTIPEKTVVWVANRDNPVPKSAGIFKISDAGSIVILDSDQNLIWSTNQTNAVNPVIQLVDTGNLVLKDGEGNSENYYWQSFDFPTDTLLPDMKLGWDLKKKFDRHLTSWKTNTDPSSGDFTFQLDFHGFPEIFLRNKQIPQYRSGPWNGIRFSGVPEMKSTDNISFNFVNNPEEITYSFTIKDKLLKSRLVINPSGILQRFTYLEQSNHWNPYWYAPKDQCDEYKECGSYGICDTNASPVCKCLKGFEPKNPQAWELRDGSEGCIRKTKLNCSSDGFLLMKGIKLPESSNVFVDREMKIDECRDMCLKNCSCSGYSNYDVDDGGNGCVFWTGELLDIRQYAENGQDFFVRLAVSDLDKAVSTGSKDGSAKIKIVTGTVFGITILVSGLIIFLIWKRKSMQAIIAGGINEQSGSRERSQDYFLSEVIISSRKDHSSERNMEELELPLYDFDSIAAATGNFSDEHKLGQGGFGCVYKGSRLVEGQEVAVKRLSKNSGQGMEEFKNEVQLIARLQHRNLVQLIGCCIEVDEKILIYEYMENRSLDSFIFNKAKSFMLDWQKRFNIILGTARGLLYLHQDSRFRIIHRDLKASNILLDGEMNPKISDFGMARIFGGDQTEANTVRVVGTYGYMSPEYAMDGHFSVKSDVFSFGVLVLEIISGTKNRGFYNTNGELNLLSHAWKLWKQGNSLELVDSAIGDSYLTYEVLSCVQVALLCVQERAEDRPNMSSVLLMLSSETSTMPQPNNPGFCHRKPIETDSSSCNQDESCSVNHVTVTVLNAR